MNETAIASYLTDNFEDVQSQTADGSHFFFHGPEHKFPFVTVVTTDLYDQVSNLGRPGAFRLNIGVRRDTFVSLFGGPPTRAGSEDGGETAYDYTEPNRLMPHPVYGSMFWVCILNPTAKTFAAEVLPLLEEAYEMAAGKAAKRARKEQS